MKRTFFLSIRNGSAAVRGAAITVTSSIAVLSASACSTSTPGRDSQDPDPSENSVYLFDQKSHWVESKVDTLPSLPEAANLLPFDVSAATRLKFSIDAKSLSVGHDGVVRYTVVIASPQGARNVYYEGIRCKTYEWRRYAAVDENGTQWDRAASNNWRRIEDSQLNAYQAALYQDYMCADKSTQGPAQAIVKNIRYRRIATSRYRAG